MLQRSNQFDVITEQVMRIEITLSVNPVNFLIMIDERNCHRRIPYWDSSLG